MDYRIEQLRYLLREDPSSRIFYQLGELLRREDETEQAVEVLRSGLERHPRYLAAWVSLGRSLIALDAPNEAEEAFDQALSIDPENAVAARLLGETAMGRGDWVSAIKALKLARALTGSDEELDADIATVEDRLAESGQLEGPRASEPSKLEPQRFLEVVSVSSDDPFAEEPADGEVVETASDVFEIVADETEVEEPEVEEPEVEEPEVEEPEVEEPEVEVPETEESVGAFDEPSELAEEPLAADTVEQPDDARAEAVDAEEAPPIDESSVGAWAAPSKWVGVPAADAWAEPSDEVQLETGESDHDPPWAEPDAMQEPAEAVDEPPIDQEAVSESEPSEEHAEEAEALGEEPPPDDEIEVDAPPEVTTETGPDETDRFDEPPMAAEALPGEDRGPGFQELTRPIAIEDAVVERDEESEPVAEEAVAPPVEESPEIVEQEAADDARVPVDDQVEDERHELDHGVPLPTMTLAKLALDQGDHPLAMATLENLIQRDPDNTTAREMLAELRNPEQVQDDVPIRSDRTVVKIGALQGWLDAVRLAAERRVK